MAASEIPEARLASLPKWAQSEIHRLAANVEYFQAKLTAGLDDSDTVADPYGSAPRPLGKRPTIRMTLKNGVEITVRNDGTSIDVNGGDSIQVQPWSGNAVKIVARRLEV